MENVKIKRNTNGDSRVANGCPSIFDFDIANVDHIDDVKRLTAAFTKAINKQVDSHDWTKRLEPYRSMFYRDLCNTIEGRMEFMDGEWAKLHYEDLERHHLRRYCPEDVTLIDVIEMLCDCVAAGMARSGEVYDVDISADVLLKATKNTVEMLKNSVTVVDE